MLLRFFIIFIFLICAPFLWSDLAYQVDIKGNIDESLAELLRSSSQLELLKESTPTTENALKRRAEADVANFLKVLQSKAFYSGKITLTYSPNLLTFDVDTGPAYYLNNFTIQFTANSYPIDISLAEIGISLETLAFPKVILAAEDEILRVMEEAGFPLAQIKDRKVLVDEIKNQVSVTITVDSGFLAFFGKTKISGIEKVKPEFFLRKIAWKTGDPFTPSLVESTQNALEASGLFSSITISHPDQLLPDNTLPMTIELIEGKHRSIGAGITYNTERGPGITAEWEHRNFWASGEKLNITTSLWKLTQEAKLLFLKPDFLRSKQDLIWLLEGKREHTRGYTESFLTLSNLIERQVNENLRTSFGSSFKILRDTRSDANGHYTLFKLPFQILWSDADSLLDPTIGKTFNLKIIPSFQILAPQFAYCINTLTSTFYHPLSKKTTLANKITLGSIWGSSHHTIPSSERFYEGSENCLRGYHYLTVSPLNNEHKPIGGRSMFIYSLELRQRFSEIFGGVLFYEVGNVYSEILPQFNKKVLQSTGLGVRYHTPVGPLRVDFAVPLNRRRHVDSAFQVYLSIGQAF
jgi:translocation and assembly module TamA